MKENLTKLKAGSVCGLYRANIPISSRWTE